MWPKSICGLESKVPGEACGAADAIHISYGGRVFRISHSPRVGRSVRLSDCGRVRIRSFGGAEDLAVGLSGRRPGGAVAAGSAEAERSESLSFSAGGSAEPTVRHALPCVWCAQAGGVLKSRVGRFSSLRAKALTWALEICNTSPAGISGCSSTIRKRGGARLRVGAANCLRCRRGNHQLRPSASGSRQRHHVGRHGLGLRRFGSGSRTVAYAGRPSGPLMATTTASTVRVARTFTLNRTIRRTASPCHVHRHSAVSC